MTFKRWLPTFLAFPIGGWIALETVGSSADPLSAAAGGVIAGAPIGAAQGLGVGAAQGSLLGRGARVAAAWTAVTAGAWSLGWLVTWNVIVDADRGHHMFGSSGAVAAPLITGLALRAMTRRPR